MKKSLIELVEEGAAKFGLAIPVVWRLTRDAITKTDELCAQYPSEQGFNEAHWRNLLEAVDRPPPLRWPEYLALEETTYRSWLAKKVARFGIATEVVASQVSGAKRGRKVKYNWRAVRDCAFALLDEHGDYETCPRKNWNSQSNLEEALLMYMSNELGEECAPSTLRQKDKLPTWLNEWRERTRTPDSIIDHC